MVRENKRRIKKLPKVIKSSLRDATCYFGFLDNNPAGDLQISKAVNSKLKKTL